MSTFKRIGNIILAGIGFLTIFVCALLFLAALMWPSSSYPQSAISTVAVRNGVKYQVPSLPFSEVDTDLILQKYGPLVDIAAWGAKCNGTTDDTASIQNALNTAGLLTNPPNAMTVQGFVANARQGLVRFPLGGKTCTVAGTLNIPPGVTMDLNGSTLKETGTGNLINIVWQNAGYSYGIYSNVIKNGTLIGPGTGTSVGRGLFLQIVNGALFEDLVISGFKFGWDAQEMQYSTFINVFSVGNLVNCYVTSTPGGTVRPSVDNLFLNSRCALGPRYGLWIQNGSFQQFYKLDANGNGSANIVIGKQLPPYINNAQVTGGSGCPASSNLPITITDGTGTQASGIVTTNASGVPVSASILDGGINYSAPTFSVSGCTVAPTVTASVQNDTGLGDWDGTGLTANVGNVFVKVKAEMLGASNGAGGRPDSGYAVVITDNNQIETSFDQLAAMRDSGSGGANFVRLMRNSGVNTIVSNPLLYVNQTENANPANANDYGLFRNMGSFHIGYNSGLGAHWMQYTIDANGNPDTGGPSAIEGFDSANFGKHESVAFGAFGTYYGNTAYEAGLIGDAAKRWTMDLNGDMSWGSGSAASDATLHRSAAGTLDLTGTAWSVNTHVGMTTSVVISGCTLTYTGGLLTAKSGC